MSRENQLAFKKGRSDALQGKNLDPNVANLSATRREKEIEGFHVAQKEKEKPAN